MVKSKVKGRKVYSLLDETFHPCTDAEGVGSMIHSVARSFLPSQMLLAPLSLTTSTEGSCVGHLVPVVPVGPSPQYVWPLANEMQSTKTEGVCIHEEVLEDVLEMQNHLCSDL